MSLLLLEKGRGWGNFKMIQQLCFSRRAGGFCQFFIIAKHVNKRWFAHVAAANKSILRPVGYRAFFIIGAADNVFGWFDLHGAKIQGNANVQMCKYANVQICKCAKKCIEMGNSKSYTPNSQLLITNSQFPTIRLIFAGHDRLRTRYRGTL